MTNEEFPSSKRYSEKGYKKTTTVQTLKLSINRK
jgi:hypothetical protein